MTPLKIAVLGAGNMGTALAHVLAGSGHAVTVWDHFPEVVEDIRVLRENRRFLPGTLLHSGIVATTSMEECVAGAALAAVSVPSAFVMETLVPAVPFLMHGAVLLNVAKGFGPGTRTPLPFMIERLAPGHPCVHVAGPAIANELARGMPAHIALAAREESAAAQVAAWLAGSSFVPSITTDVAGAALGGIMKNVYAILLGILETLGTGGRNQEAAAITACLHEMAGIAVAQGGSRSTLYGMAGLGDLIATGLSGDSHNRRFGEALARGRTAEDLKAETGWLPEGAQAVTAVCVLARAGKVAAPLAGWVRGVLAGASPCLESLSQALRTSRRIPELNASDDSPNAHGFGIHSV